MAAKKRKVAMHDTDKDGNAVTTPVAPVIPIKKAVVAKEGSPGYFRRIVSNVKGRDMDIPLAACTAVVSERNRAGKTAVLDAIRLALTGKHPIGPDAVDLAGLTADASLPFATLSGDAASTTFFFPDGKKTPALTVAGEFLTLPTAEAGKLLPMVANRDLLTLGTAKAREGLFRRYGAEVLATATVVPVGLSPEQGKLWNQAIEGDRTALTLDTVEKLAAAGTWIRSHKLGLGKQVKALEEEKQRLHDLAVAAGAGAPTDDLINGIQKKIDTHRAMASTTLLRSRAAQSESRLLELIPVYQNTPQPMKAEEFEAAKAAITAKYPMDQLRKSVETGQEFITAQQKNVRLFTMMVGLRKHLLSSGDCLICVPSGYEHDNAKIAQLVKEAEEQLKTAQLAVQAAEHSWSQDAAYLNEAQLLRNNEIAELERTRAQQTNVYERVLADIKAAKANHEAAQAMLAEAGVAEVPSESLEVLQQQLQALNNAKAEGNRATTLASDIRRITTEQEDTKTVEKQLGLRLNELVASVRTSAQSAVNAWMPSGFVAALMLEDTDGKPACRWEVLGADGQPHPRGAMSGAETAALQVAIACAWSDGQKYRFLLLDDADLAGFNAENVRNALTMVAAAVKAGKLTQAFVAWSRPQEIPDEGWSVVQL